MSPLERGKPPDIPSVIIVVHLVHFPRMQSPLPLLPLSESTSIGPGNWERLRAKRVQGNLLFSNGE